MHARRAPLRRPALPLPRQPPCIHHTFAHVKPLAALLDSDAEAPQSPAKLPRESAYGVKYFEDIRTYLAAKGAYRATVTGYDT